MSTCTVSYQLSTVSNPVHPHISVQLCVLLRGTDRRTSPAKPQLPENEDGPSECRLGGHGINPFVLRSACACTLAYIYVLLLHECKRGWCETKQKNPDTVVTHMRMKGISSSIILNCMARHISNATHLKGREGREGRIVGPKSKCTRGFLHDPRGGEEMRCGAFITPVERRGDSDSSCFSSFFTGAWHSPDSSRSLVK